MTIVIDHYEPLLTQQIMNPYSSIDPADSRWSPPRLVDEGTLPSHASTGIESADVLHVARLPGVRRELSSKPCVITRGYIYIHILYTVYIYNYIYTYIMYVYIIICVTRLYDVYFVHM